MAKGASIVSQFLIFDGIMMWFNGPDWTGRAEEAFREAGEDVLQYAKDNAPWSDITGNARAGLGVEVYSSGGEIILELFHTVDYGLWLEVIQNGQYATIMPTLERYAPRVFDAAGARVLSSQEGEDYSL